MTGELRADLNRDEIDALQELIRIHIDSADGLEHIAASSVEFTGETGKGLVAEIGEARRRYADELAEYIFWSGQEPRRVGSYAAAIYRMWVTCRALVIEQRPDTLVEELLAQERQVHLAYVDALEETSESAVHEVLSKQWLQIQDQTRRISTLTNRDEAASPHPLKRHDDDGKTRGSQTSQLGQQNSEIAFSD
ncbi:MAG: PA2169 family four-helix-bundle protein [Planctomycetaceae bacterium]|nr:PA2169 family four-helix-bundle protein [Planctomycetaceae bacterium]